MLFSLLKRYRVVGILLAHVMIVVAAYTCAFALRFELSIPPAYRPMFWLSLPPLLVLRLIFFQRYHLFSGWWQYVGVSDVVEILKSVTAGSVCFVLVLAFGNPIGYPRSVIVLDWLLTVQFLAGARVASRLLQSLLLGMGIEERRSVLIVASRQTAETLLRELTVNPTEYHPIGFVISDDSAVRRIHQLPVLGGLESLERNLKRLPVREVFVALPSQDGEQIRAAVRACRAEGIAFRLISPVRDYLERPRPTESPTLDELFEPDAPPTLSRLWEPLVRDRTVLLLGAAGVVGSSLAAAIASVGPRQLLLFDANESALYYLEVDLLRKLPTVPLAPLVGDVLDDERLRRVLAIHRPEIVIHAAAYSGDVLAETNLEEIRRNNLLGAARVVDAVGEFGVERLMLLSLDEGDLAGELACLHRVAEHYLRTRSPGRTVAFAVRFPSVVGNPRSPVTKIAEALRGSPPVVLPALDSRIRIVTLRTVTPLLLDALAVGEDGDVLAIEAGETQTVEELVRYLRRVWNLPDAPVEASSLLPDHLHPLEIAVRTSHPQIHRRMADAETPPCVIERLGLLTDESGPGERPGLRPD